MASDNTTTKLIPRSSISEPDNAHSWFGSIPRELRDQIYDLIFQEKEHPKIFRSTNLEPYYLKTRTTLPEVRLVSKKLKQEYDERDKHHLAKKTLRICQVQEGTPYHFCGEFHLSVPTLAVRTTILHLDVKCCQETQADQKRCLLPAKGMTLVVGGIVVGGHARRITYDIADLPLLEKAYVHVSCNAMKRALDAQPTSDSPAMTPILAQISTFQGSYVQAPSPNDTVRAVEDKPPGSSPSQSGRFLVRRQTKAIWTPVNGWDNEPWLNHIREREMYLGGRGVGTVQY
jgi:hypothetical protein